MQPEIKKRRGATPKHLSLYSTPEDDLINNICSVLNTFLKKGDKRKIKLLVSHYCKQKNNQSKSAKLQINLSNQGDHIHSLTYATDSDLTLIAKEVCKTYGITLQELKSTCRKAELVQARREFCIKAKTDYLIGVKRMAYFLGKRDHTTILHLLKWSKP